MKFLKWLWPNVLFAGILWLGFVENITGFATLGKGLIVFFVIIAALFAILVKTEEVNRIREKSFSYGSTFGRVLDVSYDVAIVLGLAYVGAGGWGFTWAISQMLLYSRFEAAKKQEPTMLVEELDEN